VKLDRSDIIHGYPAKKIRDFLGHGRNGAFSYSDSCKAEIFFEVADDHFGQNAKAVTAELLKRGWILRGWSRDLKECTEDQNTAIMILTQTGKQSRIMSLNKRFSRADGEDVVAELVERAKAINTRDDLLCGISELRLYGSMLDPKAQTVGDVDVAYELFYKPPPVGTRRSEWHIERAKQSGRNLQFGEMISYGATEVERLLKARKSRLSLMEMFNFEHLQPMPRFRVILKVERRPEHQNKTR
jgi:chorismate-pyruvate lyase